MAEQIKKGVTGITVEERGKRFKRLLGFLKFETVLWLVWPTWIKRYLAFRRAPWTNRLWRKKESVVAFLAFSFISLFLAMAYLDGAFTLSITWVLCCVVMNSLIVTEKIGGEKHEKILVPGVSLRWIEPSPAAMFESKRPIMLSRIPDTKKDSFVLGINAGGVASYSFARPKHVAVFGDAGNSFRAWGQHDFVKYMIMRAFEVSSDTVVLVMDKDRGGLDLEFLRYTRGVTFYETADHAFRALRCVAGIIQDRRNGTIKDWPHIIIVADASIADVLIAKHKSSLSPFVIDLIVNVGKSFNVTVIAAPSPKFTFMDLSGDTKNYVECAQFFTNGTHDIDVGGGKTVAKKVNSPRPAMDYFLWRMGDKLFELRAVVCSDAQIKSRIEEATRDLFIKGKWFLKYSLPVSLFVLIPTLIKFVLTLLVFFPLFLMRVFIFIRYAVRRIRKQPAQLEFSPLPVKFNWPWSKKFVASGYSEEMQTLFDKFGALDFPEYRDLLMGQEDKDSLQTREVKINIGGDKNEWNPQPNEFTVAAR